VTMGVFACELWVRVGRRGRRGRCENVTIATNKFVILFTPSAHWYD
jgi:hypothetical protein